MRISRLFATETRSYVGLEKTPIGRLLRRVPLSRRIEWEQGHVFLQQRWWRAGGSTQWFPNNPAENIGLRKIGNAGINLMPMPRSLNRWFGRHAWASFGMGIGVFGGGAALVGGSGYLGFQIGSEIFGE